jgi:O-antigen/teichoic acid export membrane protein
VALRGDQLLLGRLLGSARLGFYNIALSLAEMPDALIGKVIGGAVYPTLARVRNEDPNNFTNVYYRMRGWLDPLAHMGLGALIALSTWIIDLLYDDRYAEAATMLGVLAVRTSIHVMAIFCETCFLAYGESNFSFRRNLFVSGVLLVAMPVGSYFGGVQGVLWGSVAARSTALVVLWPEAYRRGFLRLHREALVLPYLATGYGLGKLLAWLLPGK